MNELSYYLELSKELKKSNTTAYEELDEELNIILHKLKFIPNEIRPRVQVLDYSNTINENYLKELLRVAGAQNTNESLQTSHIDILIFLDESNDFLNYLPSQLQSTFSESNAVKNNKIYIIQKPGFATNKFDYIKDVETLAEIVQSKYFHFGHEGVDWVNFGI